MLDSHIVRENSPVHAEKVNDGKKVTASVKIQEAQQNDRRID